MSNVEVKSEWCEISYPTLVFIQIGAKYDPAHRWRVKRDRSDPHRAGWGLYKSVPHVCTPAQRTGLNKLDAGRRVGVWGEGDFGFVICDFILSYGYISGVG